MQRWTGEAPSKTVAQGPHMVIQEISASIWEPNARCDFEGLSVGQGDGSLAEAQTCRLSGHVGSVKVLLGY